MTHLRCTVVLGAPSARDATRFSSLGFALLLSTLLAACASSQSPAPVASADVAKSYKQAGKPLSGSRAGAGTASAVGDGVGRRRGALHPPPPMGSRAVREPQGRERVRAVLAATVLPIRWRAPTQAPRGRPPPRGRAPAPATRTDYGTSGHTDLSSLSDNAGLGEDGTGAAAQARAGTRPGGRSAGTAGGSDAFGDDDGGLARHGADALGADGRSAAGTAGTRPGRRCR